MESRTKGKADQAQDEQENWPQSPWRWVNLLCIFLALASSASCMTTFSSVSTQVAEAYETSAVVVNTATIVYFASFIISNFPAVYAMEAGTQGYGLMMSVSSHSHLYRILFIYQKYLVYSSNLQQCLQ